MIKVSGHGQDGIVENRVERIRRGRMHRDAGGHGTEGGQHEGSGSGLPPEAGGLEGTGTRQGGEGVQVA